MMKTNYLPCSSKYILNGKEEIQTTKNQLQSYLLFKVRQCPEVAFYKKVKLGEVSKEEFLDMMLGE